MRSKAAPTSNTVTTMPIENGKAQAVAPLAETQAPAEVPGAIAREATGAASSRLAATLMRATLAGTPIPARMPEEARDERLGAALDLAAAFSPRDAVQGAMASMAASLFFGATDLMRRAQSPELPPQIALSAYKTAARLGDAFAAMTEAIQRRQGGAPAQQVVRVEHVTVEAGANAVIGAVTPTKPGESS
jgi:hypothetical protein